jgi:hypothetical protein
LQRICFLLRPGLILAAVLLALAAPVWQAQGFVLLRNEQGAAQLWDFENGRSATVDPQTHAIRWFLHASGALGSQAPEDLNAVRVAFDQWAAIPQTSIRFEEAGLLDGSADVNTADHTNLVYWSAATLVNSGRDSIAGRLAVTFTSSLNDVISEGDIVFNAAQFEWFNDYFDRENPGQFIESTALHEIGHLLGLSHSPAGGATMFPRGARGVNLQTGLSSDELAAGRALYPAESWTGSASISGEVTANGRPVFGAVATLEDLNGNLVSSTLSDRSGRYSFSGISAGSYALRASPLDPPNSASLARLLTGSDIHSAFNEAETDFLPTENREVTVTESQAISIEIEVVPEAPVFRPTRLLIPSPSLSTISVANSPVSVPLGATDYLVGIASPDPVPVGAALQVTGTGVSMGQTEFINNVFPGSNPAMNLIYARLTVAPDAAPGLRSIRLLYAGGVAWANGFLEIEPAAPDFNFDGLSDLFQRANFPLFTAPEAAPFADPDEDRFPNQAEFAAGSNPRDPASRLEISSIARRKGETIIRWQSEPGKSYRILFRREIPGAAWIAVGAVTADSPESEFIDSSPENGNGFYQIEVAQ